MCSADFLMLFTSHCKRFVTGRRHTYFRQVVRAPQPCRTLKIVAVFNHVSSNNARFEQATLQIVFESPYLYPGINLILNCEITKKATSDWYIY